MRNEIFNELQKQGYDVKEIETIKNGVVLFGIAIQNENNNTSPIFYTERYSKGWTLEAAVEDIIKTYENVKTKTFDTKKFFNWDYMKDNLQLCIQKRGIENILKKDFLDLEIYIRCIVDADSTGTGSFKIKEEHLKTIGMDAETVFAQAIKCSKKEITIKTMAEIMSAEMGIEIPEELSAPMQYVISNKAKINGAAAIAIPEVLSELAEKLNGDLVILPSSIHEVIVMKDEDFEPYTLNAMVQEVNETALVPEEILSNHAYKFLRGTKEVICL